MRAWMVGMALFMVGAVFAGCIGDNDEKIGAPTGVDTGPQTLWILDGAQAPLDATAFAGELPAFSILKSSDRISGEPTLGITRTGAAFYAAIDFDVCQAAAAAGCLPSTWYMRSTDGGLTWEDKSPEMGGVKTHPTSFDPYVYVDPTTGRVFAMDMGPHVLCNKVSWSDDDGESWITREGACVPGANDHPTLFAGPGPQSASPLYPNMVYLCTNQVTDSICYVSPDGGITWTPTQPAYLGVSPGGEGSDTPVQLCGGLTGHGHASWADGTVYIGRDWCNEVQVSISRDYGVTWNPVVISAQAEHNPADHDVSIATDREGNVYAFWVGNGGRAVYLSTSNDMGESWTTPLNVTAPGVTAVKLPSIVGGETGRIAFLYIGTDNPLGWYADDRVDDDLTCTDSENPNYDPNKPKCFQHPDVYNNTTWNGYIGISLNANTDSAVFATVLANPVDEPLKRGGCAGRCFGNQGGMYDFLDIDIDPMTGDIWAALVDVCSAECDGPGKGKFSKDMHEKAIGAVAKMVAGIKLLDAPIAER